MEGYFACLCVFDKWNDLSGETTIKLLFKNVIFCYLPDSCWQKLTASVVIKDTIPGDTVTDYS